MVQGRPRRWKNVVSACHAASARKNRHAAAGRAYRPSWGPAPDPVQPQFLRPAALVHHCPPPAAWPPPGPTGRRLRRRAQGGMPVLRRQLPAALAPHAIVAAAIAARARACAAMPCPDLPRDFLAPGWPAGKCAELLCPHRRGDRNAAVLGLPHRKRRSRRNDRPAALPAPRPHRLSCRPAPLRRSRTAGGRAREVRDLIESVATSGGHFGRPGRGGAHRGPALAVRHAGRPPGMGRGSPVLSAQDPHRAPRPHHHDQEEGRPGALPRREESPYDAFGVGHSSTSISAAGHPPSRRSGAAMRARSSP